MLYCLGAATALPAGAKVHNGQARTADDGLIVTASAIVANNLKMDQGRARTLDGKQYCREVAQTETNAVFRHVDSLPYDEEGYLLTEEDVSGITTSGLVAHYRQGGFTSSADRVSQWNDVSGDYALYLPCAAGNYASTPDSPANSITGDIDIRAKVALTDWSPAASNCVLAKNVDAGNQISYRLEINAATVINYYWITDGTVGGRT